MQIIDLNNIKLYVRILPIYNKNALKISDLAPEHHKQEIYMCLEHIGNLNGIDLHDDCELIEYRHYFLDNPYDPLHPQCLKAIDINGVDCFFNLAPIKYLPKCIFKDKNEGDEVIIKLPIWMRIGNLRSKIQDTYAEVHFVVHYPR